MAASPRRCRPLAQEYLEVRKAEKERRKGIACQLNSSSDLTATQKVLPNMNVTASSADSGFKFSREDINKQMDKMKEAKDKSLAEYWPHLGQKVKTEDFDIPMRDGEKVLIRVYTPNESPIESGKRPVVYSYVFGL